MKSIFTLLSSAIIFASCTTAYKTGQTPDDVYYSPARPQDEYVRVEKNEERQYRSDEEVYDDRYLRMKIRNRNLWSTLDNDWYYYNPYVYRSYNDYYYYNSPWNPRTHWNYYYNPYGGQVIVVNPKTPVYNKPRTANLHVFDQYNTNNPKTTGGKSREYSSPSNNTYGNSPSRNAGSDLRDLFGRGSSGNSSSSSSNNTPTRTESSPSKSSSSSSSGSSSSGTNAPVRKN